MPAITSSGRKINQYTSILAIVAFWMLSAPGAMADGLLYDMPKDGAWVKYDLELVMGKGQQQMKVAGHMIMSVTGTVKENDKTYRWVEFQRGMRAGNREETIFGKVLVPDEHLKKGGKPMEHWGRGWLKDGNGQAKALTMDDLGPLPAFLASPLSDTKDLKKKEIESKLGKLECAGVSGVAKYEERPGRTTVVTFDEIRLHEKAPFGVVSASMNVQTIRENGQARDQGSLTLKLVDTGDDAKTALPENK